MSAQRIMAIGWRGASSGMASFTIGPAALPKQQSGNLIALHSSDPRLVRHAGGRDLDRQRASLLCPVVGDD
ncbi:MAG: hypothetical protein NZM29_01490 [Nitrospira sp.]|nr:hypothetical protein [Nitrospira sp.]